MSVVMKLAVPSALTSSSNNSVITANRVTGLETPVTGEDATNKTYVDAFAGGSPGGLDTSVQFNDGGSFNGISDITTNGSNRLDFNSGSGAFFKDGASVSVGTGNDYVLTHNGGTMLVQNSTGDILTYNSSATDDIIFKLGNNTTDTKFYVQNLAGQTIMEMNGDGTVVVPNGTLGVRGGTFKRTTVTTDSTAGDIVYTAAQMFGGYIKRDPDGVSRNDTTATAALILALFGTGGEVGSSFDFTVKNTSGGVFNVTLNGGTGVTIDGTGVIANGTAATFKVVMTDVGSGTEACTILDI